MRIAAFIFVLTGLISLAWMIQQVVESGFHFGALLVILIPLVVLFQGWHLWNRRPSARMAGVATSVILVAVCASELFMLSSIFGLPISVFENTPSRLTLLTLWLGVFLFGTAALSLALPD